MQNQLGNHILTYKKICNPFLNNNLNSNISGFVAPLRSMSELICFVDF